MREIVQLNGIMLGIGFILDILLGDPEGMPHIIRLIGTIIATGTKKIRSHMAKNKQGELFGGSLLVGMVLLLVCGAGSLLLIISFWIHPYLYVTVGSIICYQMLAMKDLRKESMRVYFALQTGKEQASLIEARQAVGRIVGRDTENLDESGIIRATVETVAENTADGVIAPIFYLVIGGPVFGLFYKAVNTMDSMVGYKNEEYLYFGRVAAKLDDVVNFVPARVAALLMILASGLSGLSMKNATRIYKRDRYCHASPNSAQTEAVMAGALQVQLAGDAYYFGKKYEKPTIGDATREITCEDIKKATQVLCGTAGIAMGIVVICYVLF